MLTLNSDLLFVLSFAVAVNLLAAASVLQDLRLRRITGATVFLLVSLMFVNVGMMLQWANAPRPAEAWVDHALMVATVGTLSFLVGKIIHQIFGHSARLPGNSPYRRTKAEPRNQETDTARVYRSVYFTCAAIIAAAGLYFVLLGSMPLLSGLQELAASHTISNGLVSTYRNASSTYAGAGRYIPGQGLLESIRYWGLPLVIIWSWILIRQDIGRKLGITFIVASIMLLIATGQRWPLMYVFVAIFAVGVARFDWSWSRMWRLALGAISAGVMLSALLGRGAQGVSSVSGALIFGSKQLVSRLFLEQIQVPFASYAFERSTLLAGNGLTWIPDLIAYLPGPGISYPVTFCSVVLGKVTGFTAPPDFYTEAWINGGWSLVIILSFAWGLFLARVRILDAGVVRTGYRTILVTVLGFSAAAGISQSISVFIVFTFAWGVYHTHLFWTVHREKDVEETATSKAPDQLHDRVQGGYSVGRDVGH